MTESTFQLSSRQFLRNYHDAYYRLFHLPLDWVGLDVSNFTICGKEHCNALCCRIMGTPKGASCCRRMTQKQLQEAQRTKQPVVTRCHGGFYDVAIPIFTDGKYIGSLCIGQYLTQMPSQAELENICQELSYLKITPKELKGYYEKTRILTEDEAGGLIDLIQMLGKYICDSYGQMRFLESVESSDPIRTAERYIQHHYAKTLSVAGIARIAGMSKSYFIHQFSKQIGISPINYLNRYRIEKATELLRKTHLSIAEIALQCGFNFLSHFNTQFKKITGTTPRAIRQSTEK